MNQASLDSLNPTLIIIRGVPGSGKSYLAHHLKKRLGNEAVAILDPDTIDQTSPVYIALSQQLTNEGVDTKLHPYRFLRAQAHDAIANHRSVIWNQGFMDFDGLKKTIDNLQAYASTQNINLPVLIVEVEVPQEIARARVLKREQQGGHGVPEAAFAGFMQRYESFAGRGFTTVTVHGGDDVTTSESTVLNALRSL